ncbi:MAG: acyl-CoA dehydrogenase [Syntrophaceae bacterium]|jgi:acyl-CoA dehydrogenase|nr:acyl-CoA dehydrogenase [Syntrophaceae bacterium]
MNLLLNPKAYNQAWPDEKTAKLMEKTIAFFETKGLKNLKEDDQALRWYDDFIRFLKDNQVFSTLLTPAGYGAPDSRYDLSRVCHFSELLGFYGNAHQYAFQVSILGLGPVWMGTSEKIKRKAAQLLQEGGIFAFGLSEKEHGADLYSNEMKLCPQQDGTYKADGSKYYIGNSNLAALVSVQGKQTDTDEYVFFAVSSQHHHYKLVKKIPTSGARNGFVGEFELVDYPITEEDILSRGKQAWDSALSTVNIGKFQLGFLNTGICTHSFYEAINHASNRIIYGKPVTALPHIKKFFVETYLRITAMKLYALRSLDYFRSSSDNDRRYLLFNPIQKAKVTTEGVKVMEMLLDIMTAKGYEQDTYTEMAIRDIGMPARLEGTAHVNLSLVIKFLENYFSNHVNYPTIPKRNDPADDAYIFKQYSGGLAKVKFPDYRLAYEGVDLPNVVVLKSQADMLKAFMEKATPGPDQRKNIDYMLAIGEMFSIVVYAQLILENCKIYAIEPDLTDSIFGLLVQDFSHFALTQITKTGNTDEQEKQLWAMIMKPVVNAAREMKIWDEHVKIMNGAYQMNQ